MGIGALVVRLWPPLLLMFLRFLCWCCIRGTIVQIGIECNTTCANFCSDTTFAEAALREFRFRCAPLASIASFFLRICVGCLTFVFVGGTQCHSAASHGRF